MHGLIGHHLEILPFVLAFTTDFDCFPLRLEIVIPFGGIFE